MTKAILCLGTVLVLIASSCEKDRDIPPVKPDNSNIWQFRSISYVAASQAVSLAAGSWQLSAAAASATGYIEHGITFKFNTLTTPAPGKYLIVPGIGTGQQASVLIQNNNGLKVSNFVPIGRDSIYLTVLQLDTTKVSVSLPPVWLINPDTTISVDSVQASALLIKQP